MWTDVLMPLAGSLSMWRDAAALFVSIGSDLLSIFFPFMSESSEVCGSSSLSTFFFLVCSLLCAVLLQIHGLMLSTAGKN
jgi:hypothetical protein